MNIIKYVLFFIVSFGVLANNVSVKIGQKEVVLGSTFTVEIKFEHNGTEVPYVSFDPKNAEVIEDNSGDNSRVQIQGYFAGGKIVQKKVFVYRYTLQPVKAGHAHIRNIRIDLGSKVIRHKSIQVKVLSKARRLQPFIFRAEVDKTTAFVGEAINLNYYLYFQKDIATQPDVRKFPKLKNFLKRFELPKGGVERVSIQGKIFKRILIYKARIYPQKVGKLKIDPITISFQYPDRVSRNRDVFGMSMTFSSGRYKSKTLNSKRVTIETLALPTVGMPKNFTGLVGNHDFKLSFTREKVLVNDIIEARLEVTGEGALETLDAPKIIENENFEEFEAKTEIVELGSLSNKKVIDYTYLGKRSTKIDKKEISLSIFDPETRKYVEKKLEVPAIQIFGSGTSSEVVNKSGKKEVVKEDPESQSGASGISLVAPIFVESVKTRVFSIANINIALFLLIIIVLVSGFSFKFGKVTSGSLSEVKKELSYQTVHRFIISHCRDGDSVREKIALASISNDAKGYFNELLDKAEKNEYKGKSFKLDFNKKFFLEVLGS